MRWDIFGEISTNLMRHKKTVGVIFLLLLGFASLKFYSLQLDSSVSSLLPDSSKSLAEAGKLMELNPGARMIFVEITASPSKERVPAETTHALREIAEELKKRLVDYLQPEAAELPEPLALLNIAPFIFNKNMERLLEQKISKEAIAERLRELRAGLAGPLAFMPKKYLRDDPLGFITVFMQALNAQTFQNSGENSLSVSENGQRILLVLFPKSGLNDVSGARLFVEALERAIDEALADREGISASFAGGLRFTAENAIVIENDLKLTISLSLFFIALIYIFSVRSLGAIWLFLTPGIAVIFSGCALSALWPSASGIAMGFGAAVLGLAEDYAVLMHFTLRKNPQQKAAAISALARPMCCSASLCIAAFCVLLFSSIPALRQLGFFAAFSLFCGLAIAFFILPCCPWIDRPHIQSPSSSFTGALRPKFAPVLILDLICVGLCLFCFNNITFDSGFKNMGANSEALHQQIVELRSRWNRQADPELWVSSGKTAQEALTNAATLTEILRRNADGIKSDKVFSVSDFIPPAAIQKENVKRWENFVAAQADALRLNLSAEAKANGFRPDSFNNFTAWFSKSALPAAGDLLELLRQAGLGALSDYLLPERGGIAHALTFNFEQNMTMRNTEDTELAEYGVLLSFESISAGLNQAFAREKFLLPLSGMVCLVLLFVCFKKVKIVLLASLPPLLGLTSILLFLFISETPLNLAGAAALTLVLGLGSDYGIVMLHELSSKLSLGVFKAIFVSGLTTLAGLGVLILAKHPALRSLGSITFFGLLAEMFAVLLIVPLLCSPTEKNTNVQG